MDTAKAIVECDKGYKWFCLYVRIGELKWEESGSVELKTVEINPSTCNLDFNKEGRLVGIELIFSGEDKITEIKLNGDRDGS